MVIFSYTLHRFTISGNIAKSFREATFLTHTAYSHISQQFLAAFSH